MGTKQPTQTKKEPSPLGQSMMLTRFKLSQQKRKLKEKDKITEHESSNSVMKTEEAKSKKTSPKTNTTMKTPKKEKRKSKKSEEVEFHPNKLKRNKVKKKIVLKPQHDLKVIGSDEGIQKPPTPKRKRTSHRYSISSLNSSFSDSENRSQSPVYSELGFEEVIRIADENQNLDDEDLMEILTCPSPVWWEDPPDEGYLEDPIIQKSIKNAKLSAIGTRCRSKKARKKTPHKIIIESPSSKENEDNSTDERTLMDTATLDNRSKTDVKFISKRSKLESLLSSIKNKLNESNTQKDSDKIPMQHTKNTDQNIDKTILCTNLTKDNLDTNSENIDDSFPEISLQDKNSIESLENIEIPIEGKDRLVSKPAYVNVQKNFITLSQTFIKPNDARIFNNKLKKPMPHYVKNKKIKIIKIKNVSAKPKPHPKLKNILPPAALKKRLPTTKSFESVLNQNLYKPDNNSIVFYKDNSINKMDIEYNFLFAKDNSNGGTPNICKQEETPKANSNIEPEEYITVLNFVPHENNMKVEECDVIEEGNIKERSVDEKPLAIENDTDKNNLNVYYKKCKRVKRESKNIISKEGNEPIVVKKEIDEIEGENLCDDCNIDCKDSKIVPTTDDVKYCLKCSSIFDLDQCNYCIRKENIKRDPLLYDDVYEND